MIYKDYVHTKDINLNLDVMAKSSMELYNLVLDKFGDGRVDYGGQSTMTTRLFSNYNVLLYPFPGMHELYEEIKSFFYDTHKYHNGDPSEKFYIQCWINVYRKGDFIDWHGHWSSECNSYHGFYCVQTGEESGTLYRIPNVDGEVYIPSKPNRLVISKSDNDLHRSTEWLDEKNPRITIAFDIVPRQYVDPYQWLNHWVPI